ncbi:MAG: response regulator, partial [Acidobacteriota bacterium]|nr:response regulator [Acidobacteriota bacterium]
MTRDLRVLHVEDSEQDVALLSRHLARAGYDLTAERVETPEQMRAALARSEWDIILCDYSMPHFSAPAALALLKETGLDIPFIIISGTVGEETAVEAMRADANDYLLKDNLTRLAPAIEREVREAESRRGRMRAEDAARNAEEKYRAIFDNAFVGIYQATPDGRLITANTALARMMGYGSPEELIAGVTDLWRQHYVDPARQAEFRRRIEKRGRVLNFESRVYR